MPRSGSQSGSDWLFDAVIARVEKEGKITLTPKTMIDSQVSEILEQIRTGQFYGPFDPAEEMIDAFMLYFGIKGRPQ